jgi:hypothetical protein
MGEESEAIRGEIFTMLSKEPLETFLGVDENQPNFELAPVARRTCVSHVRQLVHDVIVSWWLLFYAL